MLALLLLPAPVLAALKAPTSDWWVAIRNDDVLTVQRMLLRQTDPNAFNKQGNTALVQAAREQAWKVFDVLLHTRTVLQDLPNAHDETPLMYLAIQGQTELALEMIQNGVSVNRLGWTPLHYAASTAQIEMAQLLIEHGAIVNAPGPDGTTPLMMAAYSGKENIVRLLLQHGADPTMFNSQGETVTDWALKRNHTSLAAKIKELAEAFDRQRQGLEPESSVEQVQKPDAGDKTEDKSSFSRYFDLDRFDRDEAGQR